MPSYKAESLIRTMILGRCRRQRMGLAVCSAKMFAGVIASILAKVRNAEKDPCLPRGKETGVQILRVTRVSLQQFVVARFSRQETPGAVTVVARRGGSELDLGPGRDRLLGRAGDHLTVAGHPGRDGVRRYDDAVQIRHHASGDSRGPQRQQSDYFGGYDVQDAEPSVDDVQPGEYRENDEHRLTRAWRRGRVEVAHD